MTEKIKVYKIYNNIGQHSGYYYENNGTKWNCALEKTFDLDVYEIINNTDTKSNTDVLNVYKNKKIIEVDNKTSSLIKDGITHNGYQFSMSENAQINFTILKINNINNTVQFPRLLITKSDEIYSCNSKEDLDAIILKMEQHKDNCIISGGQLKQQIINCTTKEQLDLIVDNRI